MTAHDWLAALKFSLPAVAFASVILGQLKNVRREGADGDKRLTFYGRVLTGLTVASAFVSLFAAGLEAILKKQDEAAATQERQRKDVEAVRAAQVDQADKAKARAEQQAARDEEARNARDVQAKLLDQKFAFLKEAAEAQRRDALISQALAKASAARLADAQRSLAEFARINYPLRKITATISVDLALGGPEVERWWAGLVAKRSVPFTPGGRQSNPNEKVTLNAADLSPEQRVQFALLNDVVLDFYPANAMAVHASDRDTMRGIAKHPPGTPVFSHVFTEPSITANLSARRVNVKVTYVMAEEPEREGEFGGQKLSVGDARALLMVLRFDRQGTRRFARPPDRVGFLNVEFNDEQHFRIDTTAVSLGNGSLYLLIPRPVR